MNWQIEMCDRSVVAARPDAILVSVSVSYLVDRMWIDELHSETVHPFAPQKSDDWRKERAIRCDCYPMITDVLFMLIVVHLYASIASINKFKLQSNAVR